MKKGIIGKKVGMTQIFDQQGKVIPVTVVEAGPCAVVQKKTLENDGYDAIQLGFDDLKASRVNRPKMGHFRKADAAPKRFLREFRFDDCSGFELGKIIKVDVFEAGDFVDVCGTSKGKGFAGTIKRYGNHTLKASHGTGPVARHAGSMAGASDPSRIPKGKKMPGHMGHERVTIQNLVVAKVDVENNLIAIKGAVPGPKGGVVIITNSIKKS